MPQVDPLTLEIRANADQLRREVRSTTTEVRQKLGEQERAAQQLERTMQRSSGAIADGFRRMARAAAAYLGTQQLVALSDSFTRLQNNIAQTGAKGAQLEAIQTRLFASAQRYGTSIEGLSGLYSKISQASGELGASQEQVFTAVNAVAASLQISGISATEASGALMQLGQSLRGGKLQAEEYNSLLDGLYPLLEAVAAGSARWGGSVAKLTADVKAGKVESRDFFAALVEGTAALEARTAQSTSTIEQGYTRLRNALTLYVGETAKASAATEVAGRVFGLLADNIGTIIPALATIGAALGVGYVANVARARAETVAKEAALIGLTNSAERAGFAVGRAGRNILAAFGGPVGLAITAVGLGLAYVASESAAAEAASARLRSEMAASNRQLDAIEAQLQAAGVATDAVGNSAIITAGKVDVMSDAYRRGARAAMELANAAEVAAVRAINARQAARISEIAEAREGLRGASTARGASVARFGNLPGQDNAVQEAEARLTGLLALQRNDQRILAGLTTGMRNGVQFSGAALGGAEGPNRGSASSAVSAGRARTPRERKGREGPSAEELAERAARAAREAAQADAQYRDEMGRMRAEELAAQAQLTSSAQARYNAAISDITEQRAAFDRGIRLDENLTDAKRAELSAQRDKVDHLRRMIAEQELNQTEAEEAAVLWRADLDLREDVLRSQAEMADAARERLAIEYRLIDLAQERERKELELIRATKPPTSNEWQVAGQRLDQLDQRRDRARADAQRRYETPGEAFMRDINKSAGALAEEIEGRAVSAMERLNDSLADAIMGTGSLKEAFGDLARSIVRDLIKIALQQAIIKPLGEALFGGGKGGGAGIFGQIAGWFSRIGGGTGAVGKRALGGPVVGGVPYMVGERGPELMIPQASGTIIPNHRINQVAAAGGGAAGMATVRLELSGDIDGRIVSVAGPVAVEVVRAAAPQIAQAAKSGTINDLTRPRI